MATSKTIEYGGRTLPRRPDQFDKEVLNEVFDGLKPILVSYMETDEENVESLRKYFLKIHSTDGYDIAREMEMYARLGGSAELVEIFDDAPFRKILDKHEKEWVDYFKVEPLLNIGDKVCYYHVAGTIVNKSNPNSHGYYSVRSKGQEAGSCYLVPWEDCQLVETE